MPHDFADNQINFFSIASRNKMNIYSYFRPIQNIQCNVPHEGKHLLDVVVPIYIDQLFTLLFTSSKFYLDFHAARKTTDLTQTPWQHNPIDNSKNRVVNLTMALGQTVGPKTAQVTETQVKKIFRIQI